MAHVKQIVGLDLGSRTMRAAWVTLRGGAPRVIRAEQMVLPVDAQDPNSLILAWLERLGLAGGFCAIPLPGAHTVFQTGRLAPNDPRTPRQAAEMELATFSEMAGDAMRCSVVDCEWDPGTRLYLMAMARPAMVEQALATLAPIQLKAADLVPAPVATFNALDPLAGPHDAPYLYINIGHQQSDLAIGCTKSLLFSRTVAVGGRAFTEAIARQSKCSIQQAEVQKHREGSVEEGSPYGDILRPLAIRLVSQIASAVGVYRGAFRDSSFAIGQVVLSGGGAQLRGLIDMIREKFEVPVVMASGLPLASTSPLGLPSPGSYDVAAGVALSAYEVAEANISLLPSAMREEIIFREKKPYWIAAGILGAITLAAFAFSVVLAVNRETSRIDAAQHRLRQFEKFNNEIEQIRDGNKALRERAEPLRRLLENGPRMRLALSLASNAVGPDDWISMVCEEHMYKAPETDAKKNGKPKKGKDDKADDKRPRLFLPGFRGGLRAAPAEKPRPIEESTVVEAIEPTPFDVYIVEGYTPDVSLKSVRDMILRLRTSPEISSVDLLSDDKVLPPTIPDDPDAPEEVSLDVHDMRRFVLRVELRRQ